MKALKYQPRTTPLTRYWFINALAHEGLIASIDKEGYITRPLRPHGPPDGPPPQPRPHNNDQLKRVFHQGDNTHGKPDWWW